MEHTNARVSVSVQINLNEVHESGIFPSRVWFICRCIYQSDSNRQKPPISSHYLTAIAVSSVSRDEETSRDFARFYGISFCRRLITRVICLSEPNCRRWNFVAPRTRAWRKAQYGGACLIPKDLATSVALQGKDWRHSTSDYDHFGPAAWRNELRRSGEIEKRRWAIRNSNRLDGRIITESVIRKVGHRVVHNAPFFFTARRYACTAYAMTRCPFYPTFGQTTVFYRVQWLLCAYFTVFYKEIRLSPKITVFLSGTLPRTFIAGKIPVVTEWKRKREKL